jgi:hypothetical protein
MRHHARVATNAPLVRLVIARVPRHLTHDAARAPHAAADVLHSTTASLGDGILGTDITAQFHKRVNQIDGEEHFDEKQRGDNHFVGGFGGHLDHLENTDDDRVKEEETNYDLKCAFRRGIRGWSAEPVEAKALKDLRHGDCAV